MFTQRPKVVLFVLGTIALCLVMGCRSSETWEEQSPRAVFEQFLFHYFRGELPEAFEMIDPAQRERFTELSAEVSNATDGSIAYEPWQMLVVAGIDSPFEIRRITMVDPPEEEPEEGRVVRLRLQYEDGRVQSSFLIWREQRWWVHLALDAQEEEDGDNSSVVEMKDEVDE